MLRGRILKTRLYDRALTAKEVAASAGGSFSYASEEELVAALPAAKRTEWFRLKKEIATLSANLKKRWDGPGPTDAWRDLAQSIFNLKEFIYIR